jgi:hypothetical protein
VNIWQQLCLLRRLTTCDSFNGGMHVDPGKTLCCPLNDNSPHIDQWTKASMGGWLIGITAAQHVWRTVKEAGFKYLHTQNLTHDPVENTWGYSFVLWFQ